MRCSQALPLVPFRWDVARPESLGRLADGPPVCTYDGFAADLRRCCARVVSAAPGCDLFFVGRSPESPFDYFCGIAHGTSLASSVRLLAFSMRSTTLADVRRRHPQGLAALGRYFTSLGLDPASLARRPRPAALVDLVYSGETFENLLWLLYDWARRTRADWPAVREKVRLVAIVEAEPKPAPGSFRWRVARPAVRGLLKRRSAVSVVVPPRLWRYLGDDQEHVAASYTPERWGQDWVAHAPRGEPPETLRLAADLFRLGRQRAERRAFVRELAEAGGLRHAEVRALAVELRGSARAGRGRRRAGACEKLHERSAPARPAVSSAARWNRVEIPLALARVRRVACRGCSARCGRHSREGRYGRRCRCG